MLLINLNAQPDKVENENNIGRQKSNHSKKNGKRAINVKFKSFD